jgi:hypothetical protein
MTVNYNCLMRQFFVLSAVCYMFWPNILISHDQALVKKQVREENNSNYKS